MSTKRYEPKLQLDGGLILPTVVSALPSSPVDGQVCCFQSSAMATDGIMWMLRYRSGGGTYKWEFIGGPPLRATELGAENLAATTFAWMDAPTVGPKITLPLAGDYELWGSCSFQRAAGVVSAYLGISKGATNPTFQSHQQGPAATEMQAGIIGSDTVTPSGTDVRLRWYQDTTGHAVSGRRIRALPIRVG